MSNIVLKNRIRNIIYPYTPYSENKPFRHYVKTLDRNCYSIFSPMDETIVAAWDQTVCSKRNNNSDILYLYPDIHRKKKKKITLSKELFPGLIIDSHIHQVLLLPYILMENGAHNRLNLVVITNHCQIYCCSIKEIQSQSRLRFKESCIWDMPGQKYPSMNEDCECYERYYPFLPDEAYEYHPGQNTNKCYSYRDNNDKEIILSRFYFHTRDRNYNSFTYMGGFEPDPIMTLIGTYCDNATESTSARIVIFATTDGGMNWFAKYEFNDDGKNENYGNPLCFSNQSGEIQFRELSIYERGLDYDAEKGLVLKKTKQMKVQKAMFSDTLEIILTEKHNLSSGMVVSLEGDFVNPRLNALLNNEFDDDNHGNNVFYKVKVIDGYTVKLFEVVSKAITTLPARHIHSINRIKDGWIITTGELYPNGWMMLANLRSADSYGNVLPHEDLNFTRVNTKPNSIQRVLGATLSKDGHSIIYASDTSSLIKEIQNINGRGFIHNTVGIYEGKIEDVDDFKKFTLIQDVKEPSFFFKELDMNYVFCGQRGELRIGIEKGENWVAQKLSEPIVHYMGRTEDFFVIDGKILRFK